MLRRFAVAAILAAGFTVSGCDTIDDSSSGRSQADLAYTACQPSYVQKAASLKRHWAFISGVGDAEQTSCYWGSQAGSAAEAVRAAYDNCRKKYAACFIFATNDGLSDWVRNIADNLAAQHHARNVTLSRDDGSGGNEDAANDGGGGSGDDGPSLGDLLDFGTDMLNLGTAVGAANGGNGSGGGSFSGGGSPVIPRGNGFSQRGAFDDCAKVFDALGPAGAAQKAECEQRARNMGTAR